MNLQLFLFTCNCFSVNLIHVTLFKKTRIGACSSKDFFCLSDTDRRSIHGVFIIFFSFLFKVIVESTPVHARSPPPFIHIFFCYFSNFVSEFLSTRRVTFGPRWVFTMTRCIFMLVTRVKLPLIAPCILKLLIWKCHLI